MMPSRDGVRPPSRHHPPSRRRGAPATPAGPARHDRCRRRGQEPELLGPSGYVWRWGQATFENWQSEFLQLLAFVVLTSFLIHRGSHESKDGDDELRATLDRVEARLARIELLAVARGAGSEVRPGGEHGNGASVREHPAGLALTAPGATPGAQ
jgi:hypothetical protein